MKEKYYIVEFLLEKEKSKGKNYRLVKARNEDLACYVINKLYEDAIFVRAHEELRYISDLEGLF